MNVFDELIDELKAENLLEDTAAEVPYFAVNGNGSSVTVENRKTVRNEFQAMDDSIQPNVAAVRAMPDVDNATLTDEDLPDIQKPVDERDFFRKRAMDEVSSLQMVEHVLSGVEREHMKIVSDTFDDLDVKKALHRFLQFSGDVSSSVHAETEYMLLRETEAWSSALAERDKNISVANIRRFCENSRPVLSSQALISLARFYRNAPFSEDVRSKFDFVMTKLFAREVGDQKRRLLFSHEDMIGHIKTLYDNWSSLSFFSTEEDEAEISLAVARFNDLAIEAEAADTFDELLEADFFSKIRVFKEELSEMFFVPEVVASGMACNVRIGNKYVDLIELAKASSDLPSLEEKYGYTYDHLISNAAGKTMLLVELLNQTVEYDEEFEDEAVSEHRIKVKNTVKPAEVKESFFKFDLLGMNKWLLALTVAVILAAVGVYVWSANATDQKSEAVEAKTLDIGNSPIKEYVGIVRSTDQTIYAITLPAFETLPEDKQKEFLQKVLQFANEKGFAKVNLLNSKGRTIGFASKDKLQLYSS